jgi:hypothetical protein
MSVRQRFWGKTVMETKKFERRPNLSVLALISFASSFAVARAFTTLNPTTTLLTSGYHIHHFWYGIILLALGGWIGISYNEPRIDKIAAVIFGVGGGLIADEVGILLALEEHNYWAGISYTFVIILLAFASILVLVNKYSRAILRDFAGFSRSRGGLYLAVFFVALSFAFLIDTDNVAIIVISGTLGIIACIIILSFFAQAIRTRLRR